MKYLLILLFLPSCWAFFETDGINICEFSQRPECAGGFRIVQAPETAAPKPAVEESEKKEKAAE